MSVFATEVEPGESTAMPSSLLRRPPGWRRRLFTRSWDGMRRRVVRRLEGATRVIQVTAKLSQSNKNKYDF